MTLFDGIPESPKKDEARPERMNRSRARAYIGATVAQLGEMIVNGIIKPDPDGMIPKAEAEKGKLYLYEQRLKTS